ncbi:MAG: hypothetical protein ACRBBT_05920 [Paracoccaceae bacterium]
MGIFWHALRDVMIGFRGGEDGAVSKYVVEIQEDGVSRRKTEEANLRAQEKIAQIQVKIKKEDLGRSISELKARKDKSEEIYRRTQKRMEGKFAPLNMLEEEFESAEAEFNQWKVAVGRPPFRADFQSMSDRIRYRYEPEMDEGGGVREFVSGVDFSQWANKRRRFVSSISGILGYFFIPLDILYALPGFQVVLSDRGYAIAAALLLGFLLYGLGEAIAYAFERVSTEKVIEGEIRKTLNWTYVSLLGLVAAMAISVIYGATTIRSVVPEANISLIEQRQIESALSRLETSPLLESNPEEFGAAVDELNQRLKNNAETQAGIRLVALPHMSADALIAFTFYAFSIVSIAIKRVANRDPVFEYHLAALHRYKSHSQFLMAKISQASGEAKFDSIMADLEMRIQNDESVLASGVSPNEAIQTEAEMIRARIEANESFIALKIKQDALTYAKWLKFWTRRNSSIEEWSQIYSGELQA